MRRTSLALALLLLLLLLLTPPARGGVITFGGTAPGPADGFMAAGLTLGGPWAITQDPATVVPGIGRNDSLTWAVASGPASIAVDPGISFLSASVAALNTPVAGDASLAITGFAADGSPAGTATFALATAGVPAEGWTPLNLLGFGPAVRFDLTPSGVPGFALDDLVTTADTPFVADDVPASMPPIVPEPSSLALLGTGLAGLYALMARRRLAA